MGVYTTEITSDKIISDNPIHQRLLQAYVEAVPYINGNVLELGCGEGRGIELITSKAKHYTGIDKIEAIIKKLQMKYPKFRFDASSFPPIPYPDNSFDTIVSFQVIEHVKNDIEFLKEIKRILVPGGKAILTTPNIKMTLTRNPWHEREYTADELTKLCENIFKKVEMKGIAGNEKVMEYYQQNKESVEKITRFDLLNLQHKLPAKLLRIPYDLLNRVNRNTLKDNDNDLVSSIKNSDYFLNDKSETNLDLFVFLEK